ncbi:putative protein N(5)-glutamine methyltransferase [Mumia zhuanghuii]|uniref:ASCH domain-containing protein n=1 Tax=Mumia zhuanghuii TaxID=2585211 RepID=A0A5C4MJD8_9ACTN|nr:putative protein N(5)-glutamine methyltransferase [Mumia zhuanghuii]TNC38831.1 putative protein N(5)-glutamine methyltransferase [Mumia zhuanghuii]TNC51790.1 putative protein N(5)-glutamine methyltransferase [Mumia zhuanghuii]
MSTPDDLVARLRAAGCVFAEDEARILVASASTPAELEEWTARRLRGEPLEHVVGWAEIGGARVAVGPGVFVPRTRTEALARRAAVLAPEGGTVLDLCCGSGAVGALVAHLRPDVRVLAADVEPTAVAYARRNLSPENVYEGDLYDPLPEALRGTLDVIAVNAPYVPTEAIAWMPPEARDHEPRVALDGGADGVDVQRRVAAGAGDWLAPGGQVLIETSTSQVPWTALALAQHGLHPRVADHDEEIGTATVAGVPVRHDLATGAMPPLEFAFPGPLRDRLAGLVASGAKTTTSSLAVELFIGGQSVGEQSMGGDSAGAAEEPEGMPAVGERWRVVDSTGATVCVVETTDLRIAPLGEVDLRHALDEGEGDETLAQWRMSHEDFWNGAEMRAYLGDDDFRVDDETLVVMERFRVVEAHPTSADQPFS